MGGKFLILINYFWTIGSLFVAGMAWELLPTKGWRALAFVTVIPVLLVLLICYFLLPESPRWLVDKGKMTQAEAVVKAAAVSNNTPLPDQFSLTVPIDKLADEGEDD